MRPHKTFPAEIEAWRLKNKASASQTAKVFGVSESTVHRARRVVRYAFLNGTFESLEHPEPRSESEDLILNSKRMIDFEFAKADELQARLEKMRSAIEKL